MYVRICAFKSYQCRWHYATLMMENAIIFKVHFEWSIIRVRSQIAILLVILYAVQHEIQLKGQNRHIHI